MRWCEPSTAAAAAASIAASTDAHLDRINVIYHEALGDRYVARAVLFDLEPGVIGAVI